LKFPFKAVLVFLVLLISACSDKEDQPFPPNDDPLVFSPDNFPDGKVGEFYTTTITVSENLTPVFEISVPDESLPRGLQLIYQEPQKFAVISGTPEEAGTTSISVTAKCFGTNSPGQVGEKEYSIEIVE
jgi:hypothetical protein